MKVTYLQMNTHKIIFLTLSDFNEIFYTKFFQDDCKLNTSIFTNEKGINWDLCILLMLY